MKVAEATYQQVIENALSAVESIGAERDESDEDIIDYLTEQWMPFAQDVRRTWQEDENRPLRVI